MWAQAYKEKEWFQFNIDTDAILETSKKEADQQPKTKINIIINTKNS